MVLSGNYLYIAMKEPLMIILTNMGQDTFSKM
ncbi:MAG: hypothetical protein IKY94_02630 [Lachnospiraceae bacterium]|nr:hypothetical protein [Lachnospiraceae bacterium]